MNLNICTANNFQLQSFQYSEYNVSVYEFTVTEHVVVNVDDNLILSCIYVRS